MTLRLGRLRVQFRWAWEWGWLRLGADVNPRVAWWLGLGFVDVRWMRWLRDWIYCPECGSCGIGGCCPFHCDRCRWRHDEVGAPGIRDLAALNTRTR